MHKKHITRGGKRFGPYYYTNFRDKEGKVRSAYLGQDEAAARRKEKELQSRVSKENGTHKELTYGTKALWISAIVLAIAAAAIFVVFSQGTSVTGDVCILPDIKDSAGRTVPAEIELIHIPYGLAPSVVVTGQAAGTSLRGGLYNAKVAPINHPIKSIEFKDLRVYEGMEDFIRIDDVPEFGDFVEVYAIDPTSAEFSYATVSAVSKGSALYKCKDWDFESQACYGDWVYMQPISPGEAYSFELTPEDPAFAEVGPYSIIECIEDGATGNCNLANIVSDDTSHDQFRVGSGAVLNRLNTSHNTTLPAGAIITKVDACILAYRDGILGDDAGDSCGIYAGENATGTPTYTIAVAPSQATCQQWSSTALNPSLVCGEVTGWINSRPDPRLSAQKMIVSFVGVEQGDNNVDFWIDWMYTNITYFDDTRAPAWYSQGQNSSMIYQEDSISLYTYWTDDINLSHALLETNESGIWQNKTTYGSPLAFTSNESWSNFTWQNSSVQHGSVIGWRIWANDTINRWNSTPKMYFTVSAADAPPSVSLINPPNGFIEISKNVTFICNATDDISLSNITFYWNYTGAWQANDTVTLNEIYNRSYFYRTDLNDGDIMWNCQACDNSSQCSFSPQNWTVSMRYCDPLYVENLTLSPNLSIYYFGDYNYTVDVFNSSLVSCVNLSYKPMNADGFSCFHYYANGTCSNDKYTEMAMEHLSENTWNLSWIRPDNIYPSIEFADSLIYWHNSRLYYNIYSNNYHIMRFINNFTINANTSFWIEIDAAPKATATLPLRVYLFDNTTTIATFQTNWLNDPNGEQVASISVTAPKSHNHTDNSSHYLVTLSANQDGTIGTKHLGVNREFWVVLYVATNNQQNSWNLSYRGGALCNTTNWWTGSSGWTIAQQLAGCPDSHIHVARYNLSGSSDGLNSTACAGCPEDVKNCTARLDYFGQIPNLAPVANAITMPVAGGYYTCPLNITWNSFLDPNMDIVTYYVYLFNASGGFSQTLNVTNSTSYYWNCSAFPDGNYSIRVNGTDPYGLFSYSDSGNFTIDKTYPYVSLNYPPADHHSTTQQTGFNWTATDNIDYNLTCNLTIDGTVNASYISSLNSTPTNFTVTLQDGLHFWNVTCWDDTGNSNVSETRNLTIDATPPYYTGDQDNSSGDVTQGEAVSVYAYWQDSHQLDTAVFRTNKTGTWVNTSYCALAGTGDYCNATIDTTGDAGKTICWNQYANDTLDNWNSTMPYHCFFVLAANTAPYGITIHDIDGKPNSSVTSENMPEVNFTAYDNEHATLSCEVYVDGSPGYGANGSVASGYPSVIKINYTLVDSEYGIYVSCSDGHLSNSSGEWNLTIDTTPPYVSIHSPANTTYNSTLLDLKVSATDSVDTWWHSLNGGSNITFIPNTTITATQGSNYITVYANDSLGNMNGSTAYFTVDSVPPYYNGDQDNSSGAVVQGDTVGVYSYWQDSHQLDTAVFRTNKTGAWVNTSYCALAGTGDYCNATIDTTGDAGKTICWNQYANDTLDNWNSTMPYHCFTVFGANTAPNTTVPVIYPATSYTNDYLICSTTLTDDQQTSLTAYWTWYNGASPYLSGSASVSNSTATNITVLMPGNITKGETWTCQVTPNDGITNGTAYNSTGRLIVNTKPSIASVDVTPDSAYSANDLTCTVSGWSDADSDSQQYYYQWYNGTSPMFIYLSTSAANILGNGNTTEGDTWNCSVTPYDGEENGTVLSDSVTILAVGADSTPPSITSYSIDPYDPAVGYNVSLNASATDNVAVSGIFANITLPDTSVVTVPLPYNYTVQQSGTHNVAFWANDTNGNVGTQQGQFIAGNIPVTVQFNAVDSNITGIPVNLTLYFSGTDSEVKLSEFSGTELDNHTDMLYDLRFSAHNNTIDVRLNGINLSLDYNSTIGLERIIISGYLVTYGINNTYSITGAALVISYAGTGYTNEDYLGVYRCASWDFTSNSCSGTWESVSGATQDKNADTFTMSAAGFSAYSIKQESAPAAPSEPSVSGGAGGFVTTCNTSWSCGDWGPCSEEGQQSRLCTDLNRCVPNRTETLSCIYVPPAIPEPLENCSDGIRNQDETGIDCGGVCGPTCQDGQPCLTDNDCVNSCNLVTGICHTPAEPVPSLLEKLYWALWEERFLVVVFSSVVIFVAALFILYRRKRAPYLPYRALAAFAVISTLSYLWVRSRKKREISKNRVLIQLIDKGGKKKDLLRYDTKGKVSVMGRKLNRKK